MLNGITWGQFIAVVAIGTAAYYGWLLYTHYSASELLTIIKGWSKGKGQSTATPALAPPLAPAPGGLIVARPAITRPEPPAAVGEPKNTPPELDEQEGADQEEPEQEEADQEPADAPVEVPTVQDIDLAPSEEAPALIEPVATIGVAQLGDYLSRAAGGKATQEQLVQAAPELENTDLLLAFFKKRTQEIQRTTTQLYAGVEEPALEVA